MVDQYFGIKDLYEVTLRANISMNFGFRKIEAGEPVLYFENVNMANLSEGNHPIVAKGGWGNMPHVVWEDRAEMTFSLSEGVISSTGMGILTSARVLNNKKDGNVYVPCKEGPKYLNKDNSFKIKHIVSPQKKSFCYSFSRDCIQEKKEYTLNEKTVTVLNPKPNEQYIFDYYYRYGDEALIYLIEKERFNGNFSLEGKFYSKDENEGLDYTNLLIMPKVRIVSDINLRLGETASPTVSVFNIIAMPSPTERGRNTLVEIIQLNEDVDEDF